MKTHLLAALTVAAFTGITGTPTHAQSTSKITLDDAKIVAEASSRIQNYVRYTFRPRWSNANPARTKVHYSVRFYDTRNTEIYRQDSSVEIDAYGSDARTSYVTSVHGKASDNFDARSLSAVRVSYRAGDDTEVKRYTSVAIINSID